MNSYGANVSPCGKPATIMDVHYADDVTLLANTLIQAESLLHVRRLLVNAEKTEFMYFDQRDDISTLNNGSLKLVDKFTYLGSSVSSTENDIIPAIDRLSVIWK